MNLSVVDKWKCSMFTDNGGTPKSSMFMAFSIQNHPAIGSKKPMETPKHGLLAERGEDADLLQFTILLFQG